jgi:hypothetical protein
MFSGRHTDRSADMGILKADNPAKQFAKDEAAQRKLRADHVAEQEKARVKAREAKAEEERLLDAGASEDDPAVTAARRERSDAEGAIRSRADAIGRVDKRLAEIAAGLAQLELEKQQGAYAIEAERRVGVLEARTQDLLNSLAAWIPAAEDVAEICLDASGLLPYGQRSATELPPAVAMAVDAVRRRIVPDVLAGNKPPTIGAKPTLVPAAPKPAPEPREAFLALQPVRYQHAELGGMQLVNRFCTVTLNSLQAETGLRLQVIVRVDDPSVPGLRKRLVTMQLPEEHHTWNLDDGSPPAGIVYRDVPSKATYRLPATFAPKESTDVRLPIAAARSTEKDEDK